MNLDELIAELRSIPDDPAILRLIELLQAWKSDATTVVDLRRTVERFIGNTWIENHDDHNRTYSLWSAFRDQAIDGVGGMTMNERLYWFGLFDRLDACSAEEDRRTIYRKLLAAR